MEGIETEYRRPGYRYQLVNIECMQHSTLFNVVMIPDEPLGDILPHLAAVLPGCTYIHQSGVVNWMDAGHIVAFYSDRITITAVAGPEEADRLCLQYLATIDQVREKKGQIEPVFQKKPDLTPLDIYRHLPGTHCGQCGETSCMAFAARVFRRERTVAACPDFDHDPIFLQSLRDQGFLVDEE